MFERLPKPAYEAWQQAINRDVPISRDVADSIAHAMKVWAMELGATHYCHIFQPLNGKTAEKHVAFLQSDDQGASLAHLSGNSLLRGETDGSSFPTGGLRDTFEATGITFWDLTSYAYVRGHTLYIPSVLISYHGDKLDFKLPLIQAKRALSRQATRVLHLLGVEEVTHVRPMLGLEQEYFLVYEEEAKKRPDLLFCGRSLFSADMPKGGEFEQTYFSRINEKVQLFMEEVNEECWSLGIYASVEHNEFSPGQYELSPIFSELATTVDQNLLVMDILEQVAKKHGFLCLLHEKPFTGMNGSGKHNNISLMASNGDNLFDPGDRQPENLQFILFISAFIQAIDRYQTLLRMACSDEGNDHRLGGFEAPPAIMSVNLGAPLQALFDELKKSTSISPVQLKKLVAPVINLSELSIDAVDRNRTAPISFSGNKFEIRTLGSSMNPAQLNTFLLAAMAEALEEIADRMEGLTSKSEEDQHRAVLEIAHDIIKDHHRILFAGDCYKADWPLEAEKRKLDNIQNYIDTVSVLIDRKTIDLLEHFDVLNETELRARKDILESQYIHSVKTQARVLTRMAQEGVYPALLDYQIVLDRVASAGNSQSAIRRAKKNAGYMDEIDRMTMELNDLINDIVLSESRSEVIRRIVEELRPEMDALSKLLIEVELYTPYKVFPYPGQDRLVVQ